MTPTEELIRELEQERDKLSKLVWGDKVHRKVINEIVPIFDDYAPIEHCKNLDESYGEICVECNMCERFGERVTDSERQEVLEDEWQMDEMNSEHPETFRED